MSLGRLKMKISIIVPVYNVEPYLRECLESVRLQTCGDWECICVDDGSTDGSGAILDAYSKADSRFCVLHQGNQGVSAARNNGLKIASGEWVGFLDGDDIWSPFAVENLLDVARTQVSADVIAFGARIIFDKERRIIWERPSKLEVEMLDMRLEYPDRAETEAFFSGKIYRRKMIATLSPFPPYRNGEDLVFLFSTLLPVDCMAIIHSEFYGYRQRKGSASRNIVTHRRLRDYLNCTMDIIRLLGGTKKCVSRRIIRRNALAMTEGMLLKFSMRELPLAQYADIWSQWKLCLSELIDSNTFFGFQKTRVKIFLSCPSYIMAWLLFYIPVWLKMKGFHR